MAIRLWVYLLSVQNLPYLSQMKRFLQLLGAAAAIWLIVAAGIYWSRSLRPTPEKISDYLTASGNLNSLSADKRAALIDRVTTDLNRLDIEQRQKLRRGQNPFDDFFTQLTPPERSNFLDRTLPEGFKQMMLAFNKMKPEQRQRIIRRALDDLDKTEAEGMRPVDRALETEQTQKIINQGLESFYNDANADVKMEMAPVIERLQKVMQNFR